MHFYREFCENQALQGVQILRGLQILYGVHFPWGVQHPRGVQIPSGINILVFSPTSLVRFRVATQTDNVRVGDWNPREGLKVASQFSDPLLFFLSSFLSRMAHFLSEQPISRMSHLNYGLALLTTVFSVAQR